MKRFAVPGIILIIVGTFFLLNELFDLPGGSVLVAVGLALLLGRAISRNVGLTIGGCITLCLGLGLVVDEFLPVFSGASLVFFSLAVAFLLMHLIDYRRIGNWPLIPGLILLTVSILLFVVSQPRLYELLRPYMGILWPALLILVGLVLLLRALISGRHEQSANSGEPSAYYQPPLEQADAPTQEKPAEPETAGPDFTVSPEGEAKPMGEQTEQK